MITTYTLPLVLSAITTLTKNYKTPEQLDQIVKFGLAALRLWQIKGETSDEFQDIAATIHELKDGGWQSAQVVAEYDQTIADLDESFAVLDAPSTVKDEENE